jgi:ubiquinone/menaquinone biosynthesis C-methylase UbiE
MRNIDLNAERLYENSKVEGLGPRHSQSKYYWATQPLIHDFDNKTNTVITDKIVLEIGCSSGSKAEVYSQYCHHYTGVDISDVGIQKAQSKNIANAEFLMCDAHKLPFSDEKFDVVIVNSLLHHLDLEISLNEIHRVLNKGGILCAREPLGINPVYTIYRNLTPKARTVDEKPFSVADLRLLTTKFENQNTVYFGFTSILSAFFKHNKARSTLNAFDDILSKTPVKYWFWQFYGFYKKT